MLTRLLMKTKDTFCQHMLCKRGRQKVLSVLTESTGSHPLTKLMLSGNGRGVVPVTVKRHQEQTAQYWCLGYFSVTAGSKGPMLKVKKEGFVELSVHSQLAPGQGGTWHRAAVQSGRRQQNPQEQKGEHRALFLPSVISRPLNLGQVWRSQGLSALLLHRLRMVTKWGPDPC